MEAAEDRCEHAILRGLFLRRAHVGAAAAAPVPLRLQPARGASYHVAPPHSTAATAVARPTGSLASLWVVVAKLCEILFGW